MLNSSKNAFFLDTIKIYRKTLDKTGGGCYYKATINKGGITMEEVITMLLENGYEVLLGVGIIISTLCNRPKTAAQLKAKKEKLIAKKTKALQKEIAKCECLGKQIDELKEVEK